MRENIEKKGFKQLRMFPQDT